MVFSLGKLKTLEQKQAYYDRVKLENYQASMRLEGLVPTLDELPNPEDYEARLKELIKSLTPKTN